MHPLRSFHPLDLLRRLHADERGNLGVLLLLTVWCLVSLIGLVWNSGEYATRKRQVQAAADSAAHAGYLWVSRTTNATAATNLVISENGSAEVILRSVEPTRLAIQDRITSEKRRASQLQQGNEPNHPEKGIPDCEYFEELLGFGAWSGNGEGDQRAKDLNGLTSPVQQALKVVIPLLPAQQQQQVMDQVVDRMRRNGVALGWLNNTWVGGAAPPAPAKGGTAQPNAVNGGLRNTISPWVTGEVRPRLQDVLSTIDTEQSYLDAWVSQTAPATNGTTPEDLQQKRSEIFAYQQQIVAMTPAVVDEQRSALAAFYNCDLTYATPGHPSTDQGPASVQPPLRPASDVPTETRSDSIRERYPQAAQARFGTSDPTVVVDAINVNVDNAVIWHPGTTENAPPGLMLDKQQFQGTYNIGGGEWGRVPCAPLSRYFNNRVSRDEQGLRSEPQSIDQTRNDMRARTYPPPAPPATAALAKKIADPLPDNPPIPIPPERIGALPSPQGLTAAQQSAIAGLNAQIDQFNQGLATYVRDLKNLESALQSMYDNLSNLADSSTREFADRTWLNYVDTNRALVLWEMGNAKQFTVLSTYALYPIPDWAQSGMHDSVYQYVHQQVVNRNVGWLTRQLDGELQNWAYGVLSAANANPGNGGGAGGSPAAAAQRARSQARAFANQNAGPAARWIAQQAAALIATEVADEWVARPWPYEITPPPQAVPPAYGLTTDDRQHFFTFLSAAKTNDRSSPKPVLSKVFPSDQKPMVAFAQAENFNWMEFNGNYGAGDAYDQITHYGHGDMGGSPRPWRLSTTGGWNWQPRLALSDALYQAIQDGPDFQDFLSQGGVNGNDQNAINTLALH